MTLKYFRYISKSKVEMLASQIQPAKTDINDISSKVSIFGLELGLGLQRKPKNDDSLASKTIQILDELNKRKMIKSLEVKQELSTTDFYQDIGRWHNGIVAWEIYKVDGSGHYTMEIHLTLKTHGNALILLAGATSNVIGSQEVNNQNIVNLAYSESIIDSILRDHIQALTLAEQDATERPNISIETTEIQDAHFVNLALFCQKESKQLPEIQLDVIFRIYDHIDLRKIYRRLSQHNSEVTNNILSVARDNRVFELSHLYIGSPICIARV